MSAIAESHVESAALGWFADLAYAVRHGNEIAPGEPATERAGYGDVVLVGRLRDAIERLNPHTHRRKARRGGGLIPPLIHRVK